MNRLPPGLLYLTIYNPTLRSHTSLLSDDDEDAEEQAHILFYTARERAASRDRMLRQVGLAKALVNFSEMFSAGDACESVHSQSRRMIMVSPEPDFWIHGCFELAKTERPAVSVSKGKDNVKKKKNKETPTNPDPIYDYSESSVHDHVLRSRLLQGYEQFKLTHGSFTSILSTLGQQALELQLERFFTVWAWTWDLEEGDSFGPQLGVPLHPAYRALTPILDGFVSQLPEELLTFVLSPPYLIPSSRFTDSNYPMSLITYVISRLPPPPSPFHKSSKSSSPTTRTLSSKTETGSVIGMHLDNNKQDAAGSGTGTPFLGMSMPSVHLSMDMRNLKWNWPGYLTFGKSSQPQLPRASTAPSPQPSDPMHTSTEGKQTGAEPLVDDRHVADHEDNELLRPGAVEVDSESLLEAMATESLRPPSTHDVSPSSEVVPQENADIAPQSSSSDDMTRIDAGSEERAVEDTVSNRDSKSETGVDPAAVSSSSSSSVSGLTEEKQPLPTFAYTTVFLADSHDLLSTRRMRVSHLTNEGLSLAVVTSEEQLLDLDMTSLAARSETFLIQLQNAINEEDRKRNTETPPSATKILQPQDKYIISLGRSTTYSKSAFDSKSEHLFQSQDLLRNDPELLEVFSRGQNPQHWHIAKRGLGGDEQSADAEVYMEIARKESSLTDVDNDLAGITRRFLS